MKILFVSLMFSSLLNAQEFHIDFPLQIGNMWQYSEGSSHYNESKVICDTIMSNNLTYTRIDGVCFNGFYRKEGTKVFSYHTALEIESLIFDFFLNVSDTVSWIIYPGATFLTTVFEKGVKKIFGQDRNYMVFFRDDINSTADGYRMVVDGLGFIQYVGEAMAFGCTGAIINGVQYGIILEVENNGENIPSEFQLLQNYPNPFNPSTTIKFSIPSVETFHGTSLQHVALKIYDLLGREVSTLVNEDKPPGNYEVKFSVETRRGESLPSGVYFYQLIAGGNVITKKFVLMK